VRLSNSGGSSGPPYREIGSDTFSGASTTEAHMLEMLIEFVATLAIVGVLSIAGVVFAMLMWILLELAML
jgi:hypothetical protein